MTDCVFRHIRIVLGFSSTGRQTGTTELRVCLFLCEYGKCSYPSSVSPSNGTWPFHKITKKEEQQIEHILAHARTHSKNHIQMKWIHGFCRHHVIILQFLDFWNNNSSNSDPLIIILYKQWHVVLGNEWDSKPNWPWLLVACK